MNTFDLLDLTLLPDLETAEVFKIHIGTCPTQKAYCSKCAMNWASLHSEIEGDHSYDYCPICKSDMDLEDFREGEPAFVQCFFSGKITNVKTKKVFDYNKAPDSDYKPTKIISEHEIYLQELERFKIEDAALKIYFEVYQKHGHEAGQKAYHEKLKELL